MLKRWFAKWKIWAEAMEGIDDPQGSYLLMLEGRIARLEGEVRNLRQHPPDRRG